MKKKDLVKQGKIIKRNAFALIFFIVVLMLFNTTNIDMSENLKTYLNMLLVLIISGTCLNLIVQFKEYVTK